MAIIGGDFKDEQGNPTEIFFAMGYGGQYIIVSPEQEIVCVFTSDLYNDTFLPIKLFRQNIFRY